MNSALQILEDSFGLASVCSKISLPHKVTIDDTLTIEIDCCKNDKLCIAKQGFRRGEHRIMKSVQRKKINYLLCPLNRIQPQSELTNSCSGLNMKKKLL